MRDQFDALEEEGYALEERRDQAEDDFRDVFESKRRELEDQVDQLREEKFKPMEEAAEALNDEIDGRWVALDDLHEQQGALTGQLEELKKRVRDLDRQAPPEFGYWKSCRERWTTSKRWKRAVVESAALTSSSCRWVVAAVGQLRLVTSF